MRREIRPPYGYCGTTTQAWRVLLVLLSALPTLSGAQRRTRKRLSHASPAFARIGGIVVWRTSRRSVEKRLGKGRVSIGFHPGSGRVWRDVRTKWYFCTDLDPIGSVVLSMDNPGEMRASYTSFDVKPADRVPSVRIPRSWFRGFAGVSLGTKAQVAQRRVERVLGKAKKLAPSPWSGHLPELSWTVVCRNVPGVRGRLEYRLGLGTRDGRVRRVSVACERVHP
jgi:hypothetical protein